MFLSLAHFLPLLKSVHLVCLAMLVYWRCILSAFFCLENSLFCPPFKMGALLVRVVLVAGLCFSLLGIFFAITFWLIVFLLGNQLLDLSGFLCMLVPISPLLHLRFFVFTIGHFNYYVPWIRPLWIPLVWDTL